MTKILNRYRCLIAIVMIVAVLFSCCVLSFADDVKDNNQTAAEELIKAIVTIMQWIAGMIGAVLLVWGIIQLVLAIRNEDGDSKSRAIMLIIVSIALIAIGVAINPLVDIILKNIRPVPDITTDPALTTA